MINVLSVDLEDYFQVSGFEKYVNRSEWQSYPSRIERNTDRVLDLLASGGVRATFFIVGWVGEHFPNVVRRVAEAGHEVACHSYWHRLVYSMTPEEFREDTARAKRIIEDVTGAEIIGYRAPSYSIVPESSWALDILLELGFQFDSSIFPVHHDRYGWPGRSRFIEKIGQSGPQALWEFPPSTFPFRQHAIPVAGGGYLRMFPYHWTKWALEYINENEGRPGCVYFHPWEIDPGQPRVCESASTWRRHSLGIPGMEEKLRKLMRDFEFAPMGEVLRSIEPEFQGAALPSTRV